MALQTLPTFTPSGYAQFATATVFSQYVTFAGTNATNSISVPTAIALPAGSGPATILIENLGPEAAWILIGTAAATTTATQATVGASTIVVASATNIALGQVVIAVGIASGTQVTGISGTTISISQPTTAALSSTAVNFVTPVTASTGIASGPTPAAPLALNYVSSGFICALCTNSGSRSVFNVSVGV
jgi:hypothetical protein